MHNYKELKIWNKAMELGVDVYKVAAEFPSDEKYGLVSQIRRSAVSIASNIAEGAGRNSNKEFLHFLSIAHGSCYELQTQLILSQKLKIVSDVNIEKLISDITEIQKMNYKFQDTLKKNKIQLNKV